MKIESFPYGQRLQRLKIISFQDFKTFLSQSTKIDQEKMAYYRLHDSQKFALLDAVDEMFLIRFGHENGATGVQKCSGVSWHSVFWQLASGSHENGQCKSSLKSFSAPNWKVTMGSLGTLATDISYSVLVRKQALS